MVMAINKYQLLLTYDYNQNIYENLKNVMHNKCYHLKNKKIFYTKINFDHELV